MSGKKGFLSRILGGNSSGGCCNMEFTEEPETKGGCCDMQIVEEPTETDVNASADSKTNKKD